MNLGDVGQLQQEPSMPTKIVDFSARSEVIRDEPFHVHFWECTPWEFRAYLGRPREFLVQMGIDIPEDCRIETTIENHDWLGKEAPNLESENGTIIGNIGTGSLDRRLYRVVSFGHDKSAIGETKKRLLHKPGRQQVAVNEKKRRKDKK
jgi:hypothetical protein